MIRYVVIIEVMNVYMSRFRAVREQPLGDSQNDNCMISRVNTWRVPLGLPLAWPSVHLIIRTTYALLSEGVFASNINEYIESVPILCQKLRKVIENNDEFLWKHPCSEYLHIKY